MCVCVHVLVTQSCLPLCGPMDWGSMPGSSVHRILQNTGVVAILSRGSSLPRDQTWVSPKLQAESLPSEPQYIAIYNLINFKISAY